MSKIRTLLVLAASLLLVSPLARAQDPAVPAAPPVEAAPAAPAEIPTTAAAPAPGLDPAVEARIQEIDQRALIAERKLELLDEEAAKAKAAAPVITVSDRGLAAKSADGNFVVKLRGLIHVDGREYLDDAVLRQSNAFLIRRARTILEASFFDVADFRLMGDFSTPAAPLLDAYADLRPFPWLKLRVGKFKPPVGLERLQSVSAIVFPERALPTFLVPNRDIGFQLHGVLGPQIATYEIGLFNGALDGGSAEGDNNYAKDWAARLFLTPWKSDPYSFLANLGVGISYTQGGQRGAASVASGTTRTTSVPNLPQFRSAGQQSIFRHSVDDTVNNGTTIAGGRRTRLSPQGYFYYENFGLLGEYVRSSQKLLKGTNVATLTHTAWQVAAQLVFGGKPLFEGVTVTNPFNPKKGTWGALELAARYNVLDIDNDAFPTYASTNNSVKDAKAWGVLLTWHWSRNLKNTLALEHTDFAGGAARGADRADENVLFQRIQLAF